MDEMTIPEVDSPAICDECGERIWVTAGHADHPKKLEDRCGASWRPVAVATVAGELVAVPIPGAAFPSDPDHPTNRRLSDGSPLEF